jgi:hypothetical protein
MLSVIGRGRHGGPRYSGSGRKAMASSLLVSNAIQLRLRTSRPP